MYTQFTIHYAKCIYLYLFKHWIDIHREHILIIIISITSISFFEDEIEIEDEKNIY